MIYYYAEVFFSQPWKHIIQPPGRYLAARDDLEKYIKANQRLDILVKIGWIIYQFVKISPFSSFLPLYIL
jgi:hypothetical protein